eukprot:6701239-Prymnesium_polylepis.2
MSDFEVARLGRVHPACTNIVRLSHPAFSLILFCLHGSFVFALSARNLWTLCPAGGAESVCVPYRSKNATRMQRLRVARSES